MGKSMISWGYTNCDGPLVETIGITTRHHLGVGEALVCRMTAPNRHRERFRYSERPRLTRAAKRRAGAWIFV